MYFELMPATLIPNKPPFPGPSQPSVAAMSMKIALTKHTPFRESYASGALDHIEDHEKRVRAAALAFCNHVITTFGGEPQKRLLPGVVANSQDCAIARTIRAGIGPWARASVSGGGCAICSRTGRTLRYFEYDQSITDFVARFDASHWRDLLA